MPKRKKPQSPETNIAARIATTTEAKSENMRTAHGTDTRRIVDSEKPRNSVGKLTRELCLTEKYSRPNPDILSGLNLTQDQYTEIRAIAMAAGVCATQRLLRYKLGARPAAVIGLIFSAQVLRDIETQNRLEAPSPANTPPYEFHSASE